MPQLVRDARYFSHCEHGVEMGESMSLWLVSCGQRYGLCRGHTSARPRRCDSHPLDSSVGGSEGEVARRTRAHTSNHKGAYALDGGKGSGSHGDGILGNETRDSIDRGGGSGIYLGEQRCGQTREGGVLLPAPWTHCLTAPFVDHLAQPLPVGDPGWYGKRKSGLDRHHLSRRGSSPSRRRHADSARTREAGEEWSGRDVPMAMERKHWLLGYEWMDRGPAWNGHGEEDPASSGALARIGTRVRARTFGRPGRGLAPAPRVLMAAMTGGFHFGTRDLSTLTRRQESRPRHGLLPQASCRGHWPACSARDGTGETDRVRVQHHPGSLETGSFSPHRRAHRGAVGGIHPHSPASTCAAESMAMQLLSSSRTAEIGCRLSRPGD